MTIEELIKKLIENNKKLRDNNDILMLANEELNEYIDNRNEEIEELKKVNFTLTQSKQSKKEELMKSRNEIITLKKSLKDIEDNETKLKEQFKEDFKEDNKAVAIINYLDNQFKRVQKNNDYLKLLLSNEKKCKKFYIDFTKSLLLNTTIDVFMAPRRHQNINGFCYTEFEINTRFINLDLIHYQQQIKALLKDINKELARLYGDEEVRLLYIESNEFSIRCKFHI